MGKITNWSELGGENIKVISLNDTEQKSIFRQVLQYINYEILKEDILVGNFSDMKTKVEEDKNAIGFVFDEYIDDNIKNISVDGTELSQVLMLIYKEELLQDNGNKFIDFILK